jgi:hypothetical protein
VLAGSSRFRMLLGPVPSFGAELQSVGFVIVDKRFGSRIDADGTLEHPSERCGMASDMGTAHDRRVGCGRFPGLDAIHEIAQVIDYVESARARTGGGDFRWMSSEREVDFAAVARFHPALFADESDGACSIGLNPAWALAEGIGEKVDFERGAVGVKTIDPFLFGGVFDWHGMVRLVGHLTKVDRVSAPVEQFGTGIKIPLSAPHAFDVLMVVRAPWCWSEPQIPVDDFTVGSRFGGEPLVIDSWGIDTGDHFGETAEFPFSHPLDGLLVVRHGSTLGACLKDTVGFLYGLVQSLTVIDGESTWLFAVDVFTGFGGHHGGSGMPTIPGGNQHGIDVSRIEQLSEIANGFAIGVAIGRIDDLFAFVAAGGLDIGDHAALDVGHFEHLRHDVSATSSDADHSQLDFFAGGDSAIEAEGCGRNDGGEGQSERCFGGVRDKGTSQKFGWVEHDEVLSRGCRLRVTEFDVRWLRWCDRRASVVRYKG